MPTALSQDGFWRLPQSTRMPAKGNTNIEEALQKQQDSHALKNEKPVACLAHAQDKPTGGHKDSKDLKDDGVSVRFCEAPKPRHWKRPACNPGPNTRHHEHARPGQDDEGLGNGCHAFSAHKRLR
jgi:hypothetical protein